MRLNEYIEKTPKNVKLRTVPKIIIPDILNNEYCFKLQDID